MEHARYAHCNDTTVLSWGVVNQYLIIVFESLNDVLGDQTDPTE